MTIETICAEIKQTKIDRADVVKVLDALSRRWYICHWKPYDVPEILDSAANAIQKLPPARNPS